MRDLKRYELFNAAAPRAIASTTNASPIEVTMAAPHGYSTGDKVTVIGHDVNTSANGTWEVTVTGPDTLELIGSEGVAAGGATGTLAPKARVLQAADFRDSNFHFMTDGGGDAALTVKIVGSLEKDPPDFAKPQSVDNQYDFLQMISLSSSVEVDGNDGIVLATEDIHKMYEVNINGVKWVSAILEGTAGELTVVANLFGAK